MVTDETVDSLLNFPFTKLVFIPLVKDIKQVTFSKHESDPVKQLH